VLHVFLLLACPAVIYLACEWFINAVEWLGVRLKIGSLAVGTVLAAAGTALPESAVTLVAVLNGTRSGDDIAVGAALGGPLVVGTLAYGITGVLLLLRARTQPVVRQPPTPAAPVEHGQQQIAGGSDTRTGRLAGRRRFTSRMLDGTDTRRLARDQTWFLVIFIVKFGLGLVAFAVKPWLGLLFLAAYAVYFLRELRGSTEQASGEGLEPLKLQRRRSTPSTLAVLAQTLFTLVVIFGASQVFVAQLEWAGPALGLPAVVVALLLAPVATELPEILNAIIWVRQGKTQLALANVSGSMMIQVTIPSALGLAFTPWLFDTPLVLAGVATMLCVLYLRTLLRTGRVTAGRLAAAGGFYAVFGVALAVNLA
jgi:cation:H+ antiporter